MTLFETSCATTIVFVALINATVAMASADERTRCAQPIARNMTVYRPPCATAGEHRSAAAPLCAPQWWALEPPCPTLENVDWATGRSFFGPSDIP